jgi:hypothetical protein
VAQYKIKDLYKITEKSNEQFLYALLAEEGAELEGHLHGEEFMELLLVMNPEGDKLARDFLSDRLKDLGWDIHG